MKKVAHKKKHNSTRIIIRKCIKRLNKLARKITGFESIKLCLKWIGLTDALLDSGENKHRKIKKEIHDCSIVKAFESGNPPKHKDKLAQPCNSQICRACMYYQRLNLNYNVININKLLKRKLAYLITIIPDDVTCRGGKLQEFDIKKYNRKLKRKLNRAKSLKDSVFIMGWDFSWNQETYHGIHGNRFWQPHLHGIVFTDDIKQVKKVLTGYFSTDLFSTVKRPVKVIKVQDRGTENIGKVASYSVKNYFEIKSYQTIDTIGKSKLNKGKPLTKKQLLELLPFLHEMDMSDRLILKGCKKSGCDIVLTTDN